MSAPGYDDELARALAEGGQPMGDPLELVGGQNAPPPAPLAMPDASLPSGLAGEPPPEAMPQAPTLGAAQAPLAPVIPLVPQPTAAPPGMSVVKGSRETQQTVPSAELQQGFAGGQAAIAGEKKLAADQQKTAEDEAQIKADYAAKVEEESRRRNIEIQAEQQRLRDEQEIRNNKYLADLDALKASKGPGGFEDWTGGKKARGYLSIALGGLARGNTGGVNVALQRIDKQVEDDYKHHAADVQQQIKGLELTHGFNADLEAQGRDDLARLEVRKQLAYEDLNKHAAAQLAALGIPKAQQASALAQLGFDAKAAKAQEDYGKIVSTKVTDTMQVRPGHRGGGGAGAGALSQLHEFARQNPGPENEAKVVAMAEHLFPGQKPAALQTLVAGAVKANADAKAAAGSKPPAVYTDTLSGRDLPVDPNRTDTRQHNEATKDLKQINTFLGTAHKLLEDYQTAGAPEIAAKLGVDVSKTSNAAAAITRLRSAYAAAKHESVGSQNSEHLEHAIPDPPTRPTTDAAMKAWRQKISDVVEEMTDLRKEGLANAGVPPDIINQAANGKPAPSRKDAKDTAIDALAAKFNL